MSNNKKKSQHNLKMIRRFDEDIWAELALSAAPSKTLDYIFEIYKNDSRYKNLVSNRRFFFSSKKFKFLYKVGAEDKEFKRKKRTLKINNYLNKLKIRRFYGNLGEKQFKRIFKQEKLSSNKLGTSFSYFLESRLDVVLYRSNLFTSIFNSRQYISHKKVFVNGKIITKPGYKLSVGDIVTLKDPFTLYKKMKVKMENNSVLCNYPSYLEVNYKLATVIFVKLPVIKEIPYPFFINMDSILHSYLK